MKTTEQVKPIQTWFGTYAMPNLWIKRGSTLRAEVTTSKTRLVVEGWYDQGRELTTGTVKLTASGADAARVREELAAFFDVKKDSLQLERLSITDGFQ